MGETIKARGTRAAVWPDTAGFITTSGSIRRWATARQRRSPRAETEACNGLGHSIQLMPLNLTYFAPKMVLTMGSTSLCQRFEEIAVCLTELLYLDGRLCGLYPKDIGGDTGLSALCAILSSLLKIPQGWNIIPIDRINLCDLSGKPSPYH